MRDWRSGHGLGSHITRFLCFESFIDISTQEVWWIMIDRMENCGVAIWHWFADFIFSAVVFFPDWVILWLTRTQLKSVKSISVLIYMFIFMSPLLHASDQVFLWPPLLLLISITQHWLNSYCISCWQRFITLFCVYKKPVLHISGLPLLFGSELSLCNALLVIIDSV